MLVPTHIIITNLALTTSFIILCPFQDSSKLNLTMACRLCHKKKIKCRRNNDGTGDCDLCSRLKLPCVPHKSQQGKRTDIEERKQDKSGERSVKVGPPPARRTKVLQSKDREADQSEMEVLDVYSQGKRYLWHVGDTNTLTCNTLSSRVDIPKSGVSTYIICTCVSSLPQGANGTFCIFRYKQPKKRATSSSHLPWYLAVVESFFYLNNDGTDCVHLLEWSGPVTTHGSPAFYNTNSWDDFAEHFTRQSLPLHSIELYYVNKVRGNAFESLPISDATRSETDKGIQCNPSGPDRVPNSINIPVIRGEGLNNLNLNHLSIKAKQFFPKAKQAVNRVNTQKRKNYAPQTELSTLWSKAPNRLPSKKSTQCVLLVSKLDGTPLESSDLVSLGDAAGLFFFPSPFVGSNEQEFYCVAQSDYSSVLDQINGVSREHARAILQQFSKTRCVMCNATSLTPNEVEQDGYQYYTRVFAAGGVAPSFSTDEYSTISLPSMNRQVTYKFCPARRFYEFIPLSVGIVDKTLHGITITNSIIERIARCLGKNGLFSNRPRSPHRGALSFLGPRSLHTVAQPNPSEGDVTSFWYYRKHLNQVWWGLVLKVIKLLTCNLKTLPILQFFHLRKVLPHLYPDAFKSGIRDFCRFAILTINFVNTIHCDVNDKLGKEVDEEVLKAVRSLLTCQYLSSALLQQAKATIHHIEMFGLSAPTTCGYQITSNDDVQVIQFFCGFGLGICYQIKNYWSHAFLPATHSHLTSAPLFIQDDKVYSTFENCNIFAWGEGDDKGSYQTIVDGTSVRRSRRIANQ